MTKVFGFTGTDPTGAMHEITSQTGDQVTLIQTWLESDGNGTIIPAYPQFTGKD